MESEDIGKWLELLKQRFADRPSKQSDRKLSGANFNIDRHIQNVSYPFESFDDAGSFLGHAIVQATFLPVVISLK